MLVCSLFSEQDQKPAPQKQAAMSLETVGNLGLSNTMKPLAARPQESLQSQSELDQDQPILELLLFLGELKSLKGRFRK